MNKRGKTEREDSRWEIVQRARRHQLRNEVSKRMRRPGAIADDVKAQVVQLGFSPREVYAEILRQS